MRLTVQDIVKATGGKLLQQGSSSEITSISIDTRTLKRADLYIAIKGAHFDGHDFVDDAIKKGAVGIVKNPGHKMRSTDGGEQGLVLEVQDTVKALGDIALAWRKNLSCRVVAITGSNGKSTTKEMIASGLSKAYRVVKTEGNFNNLIGLPLQVMRIAQQDEVAALEMGMNAPGEIGRLTEIARPHVGLITNINPAHLEKLHDVEHVARAKGELFDGMAKDGTIAVNAEDPWAVKVARGYPGKKITFGMQNGCDVQFGRMVSEGLDNTELTFYVNGREHAIRLPVPGVHNVMNALAAVAVFEALGAANEAVIDGLKSFTAMKMRMERLQLLNGVQLINDSYNANPASMQAALRTVSAARKAGRFIAVLGDMLELGETSSEKHWELGKMAAEFGVSKLFAIGDFAKDVAGGAKKSGLNAGSVMIFENHEELKQAVMKEIKTGDIVLVKGSRGMRMEQVAEFLKNEIGV